MCVVLIFCRCVALISAHRYFFAAAAFWRLNLGPARLRFFLGMSSLIRDPVCNCRNYPNAVCAAAFFRRTHRLSLSLYLCVFA